MDSVKILECENEIDNMFLINDFSNFYTVFEQILVESFDWEGNKLLMMDVSVFLNDADSFRFLFRG